MLDLHLRSLLHILIFLPGIHMDLRRPIPIVAFVAVAFSWAPSVQAFTLPTPWCVGGGGGTFLCADKEERNQLVAKNVSLDYLDFVKVAFVAETIQFVPPKPGGSRAMTLHLGGGGIGELSSPNSDTIRSRMVTVATDWFRTFCLAKGGQVVRYPLNDPIQNADRLACHSKTDIDGQSPMFGIQVSRAVVYRVADQVPVVAMEHLGGGETVLEAWGYPKVFQVGDATAQGLVIEIKAPLVKVQRTNGDQVSEMWLPIKSLRPTVRTGAGS